MSSVGTGVPGRPRAAAASGGQRAAHDEALLDPGGRLLKKIPVKGTSWGHRSSAPNFPSWAQRSLLSRASLCVVAREETVCVRRKRSHRPLQLTHSPRFAAFAQTTQLLSQPPSATGPEAQAEGSEAAERCSDPEHFWSRATGGDVGMFTSGL